MSSRIFVSFFFLLVMLAIILIAIFADVSFGANNYDYEYDFCYMCYSRNTYVRVVGNDSLIMREKAYNTYACKVYTTILSCDVTTDSVGKTYILGPLR